MSALQPQLRHMHRISADVARCIACLLGGEDAVTMRAVDRFWHRTILPIPLVRAFAESVLYRLPCALQKGRCARSDCDYLRDEFILCKESGRVVRHDVVSPYCPRHSSRTRKLHYIIHICHRKATETGRS